MKTSVCVTVYNEKNSVTQLLKSLLKQTKIVNEIIVVDGGSGDGTVDVIKKFAKINKQIKLIVRNSSRSKGRNIAVAAAKYPIIAMTDAGCVADRHWLERIAEPFKDKNTDMVAGFYEMRGESALQKAVALYLGVIPSEFDSNFLPSTRSVAFRKSLWKKIGGFPESLNDTAEDTVFNMQAVKKGANIIRVKNAVVYWEVPGSIAEFYKKIKNYAKGDAASGIYWHPAKRWKTHNIKAISIFLRYFVFILLLILEKIFLFVILMFYSFWSFNKVFKRTKSFKAGLWGVVLQVVADIAIIQGFSKGLYIRCFKY